MLLDFFHDDLVWIDVSERQVGGLMEQREEDLVYALAAAGQADHGSAVEEERAPVDLGAGKCLDVDEQDAWLREQGGEVSEFLRGGQGSGRPSSPRP